MSVADINTFLIYCLLSSIAHSLSVIKHADHVAVINKGELEMEGTPAHILKQTDNYLTKIIGRNLEWSVL